jgi:hypothetical protein
VHDLYTRLPAVLNVDRVDRDAPCETFWVVAEVVGSASCMDEAQKGNNCLLDDEERIDEKDGDGVNVDDDLHSSWVLVQEEVVVVQQHRKTAGWANLDAIVILEDNEMSARLRIHRMNDESC